jgi:phage baseplate assembly protein W
MARTQKYGIKFPIKIESKKTLLDLNETRADEVKSQLIHLIFTPQGQKLRDPLFGTNLITYLFSEMNVRLTWDDIIFEIKDKVKKFISNCEVQDVTTEQVGDSGEGLAVTIKYTLIEKDGSTKAYELTQVI